MPADKVGLFLIEGAKDVGGIPPNQAVTLSHSEESTGEQHDLY